MTRYRYLFPGVFAAGILIVCVSVLHFIKPLDVLWSDEAAGGCRGCHSDVYAKVNAFQYRHSVVEEKCDFCHIIRGFNTGRKWEISASDIQKEQIFFLKGLSWDRKYQIDVMITGGTGKEASLSTIQFVPSQVDASVDNDQRVPVIKDVAVDEVRQAVFIEAIIRWETDEQCDSIVEYGPTPRYGERVENDKVFANGHRMAVGGLKRGALYHFRVISRDIFGNTARSGDFIIDTSKQFNSGDVYRYTDGVRPLMKEANILKVKGTEDIYLKLASDKPVKAHLTINEPAVIDRHGFGLTPASASRIDACLKCHPQGISHPVGIKSKGVETKIPPEFPTIEGGMITCVTCHDPHGGDRRYFTRKDFKRDLCVSCHIKEPFI